LASYKDSVSIADHSLIPAQIIRRWIQTIRSGSYWFFCY